ncbi:Panacea domain-containing protein [Sutterella megalosphaeroides]|uniref:Antitoxin SocA-like Panacea domain-containing protein n=1 Tax=Sutterella megalosphaeroides TaxID=2494234 RepID=A0A2Z6IAW9_9BURK|nr:type II toxin-antitoxin system antitoxin SocA domain-containing protein [Sutterella megalosphaeroides]BBF23599.1 hypothetical protein SUTMEG_14900 [Sutterella megalosphaeroides]
MLTCFDVAEYFLSKTEEDAGDVISNLKLQKLVYYAQGFCLAMYGRPLFNERIDAWQHGPVCPALYHKYKENGSLGIPAPTDVDFRKFSKEDSELMDEVYEVYGQFSAWKLRNMTHEEAPWKSTPIGSEISQASMAEFFKERLND